MKNFVIVRTGGGGSYARKIVSSIHWLNKHVSTFKRQKFTTKIVAFNQIREGLRGLAPQDTVIYARAAYPDNNGWMADLFWAEQQGYRVINTPEVLSLTSNKLECAIRLQGVVSHPKTWEYRRGMDAVEFSVLLDEMEETINLSNYIIAKPLTSMAQGANVRKIDIRDEGSSIQDLRDEFNKVSGDKIVLQEFVSYNAIYRVIVIGGTALPYAFIDRPEWHKKDDWKVSVCLNKTTMRFAEDVHPALLELAERTQQTIGGEINFIDIFSYTTQVGRFPETIYTISEINTACNLTIHENLAYDAGRSDWNIHYRIARYLVEQSMQ